MIRSFLTRKIRHVHRVFENASLHSLSSQTHRRLNVPRSYNATSFVCSNCVYSSSPATVSPSPQESFGELKASLSPEETNKVLKIINEVQRSEDLLKYIIPKKRAEELVKQKNGGGMELTLDDVISIVGPKNSPKFFCSVLDKPIPVSANSAMFPTVSQEDIQRTSNVLSLIISGDRVSWSQFQRSMKDSQTYLDVTSFKQITYPFKPKMHFLTLLKEMEIVASQLPECEMCVMEEYPMTVPTPYMFTFQLQMAQAKSTLLGLLSSRQNSPLLVSIKTVAVARLFNTFVGSEKVSGQHIVDDLIYDSASDFLTITDSALENYTQVDTKVREGMSQAFLLNLAYWKLTKQIKT